MSWKLILFLAGSQSQEGKSMMDEHSMASTQPTTEGMGEGVGGLGEQAPRFRSPVKIPAMRDVRVSLSHINPRGEISIEPPKWSRVQRDSVEMFDCGSSSMMQTTSSLPLTPCELSPCQ